MYRTPAFEAFIAPAARYPAIWRLILGCVTAGVTYVLYAILIVFLANLALGFYPPEAAFFEIAVPDTPQAMALLFLTFLGMALAIMTAGFWHWRRPMSLFGPLGRVASDWVRMVLTAAVLLVSAGLIADQFIPAELVPNHSLDLWLGFLIWAVPLLFIQTTAEEMVFRGYLQQQLAARFTNPIIWMIFPSILFGLAHLNFDYPPSTTALVVCATGFFGLAAADLTRITGSLGAAMGFHFANNFFALLVVGVKGELSGLALYTTAFTMAESSIIEPLLIIDIITIGIIWAVARRLLRR